MKKFIKVLLATLLSISFLVSLSACNGGTKKNPKTIDMDVNQLVKKYRYTDEIVYNKKYGWYSKQIVEDAATLPTEAFYFWMCWMDWKSTANDYIVKGIKMDIRADGDYFMKYTIEEYGSPKRYWDSSISLPKNELKTVEILFTEDCIPDVNPLASSSIGKGIMIIADSYGEEANYAVKLTISNIKIIVVKKK